MHPLELCVYWGVWLGHVIYSIVLVYQSSSFYAPYLYPGFLESHWFGTVRDSSNYEWGQWLRDCQLLLPILSVHSLIMNLCPQSTHYCFWMLAHMLIFGLRPLLMSLCACVLYCIIVAVLYDHLRMGLRSVKTVCWMCALVCMAGLIVVREWSEDGWWNVGYKGEVLLAYKFMQLISYSFDYCTGNAPQSAKSIVSVLRSHIVRVMYYAYYLPYSIVLICPYNAFVSQLGCRVRCISGPVLRLACRLVLWFCVAEGVLCVLYFNSMMLSPDVLRHMPVSTLCAVGYLAGQWFYVKYVVMFGTFTLFAMVDGMNPPWPPVCISRVSLYSRMWRYFDRGLYGFLREYVYVPLLYRPTALWKCVASSATFSFVCLWHGGSWSFMFWAALNLIEIIVETVLSDVIRVSLKGSGVKQRLAVLAHIPCTLLGILAIFFFLGDNEAESGLVFLYRIFFDNFCQFTYIAFHISALGYSFAQCCIFMEKKYGFK